MITQHTRTSRQYIYKLISEIVALYNNKRLARLLDTQTRQLKTSSSAEQSNGMDEDLWGHARWPCRVYSESLSKPRRVMAVHFIV